MKKSNRWRNLVIVLPPLMLIGAGLAVFIFVQKLSKEETRTITAVPVGQSSASASPLASASATPAPVNPITTTVKKYSSADIATMQRDADSGKESWRLDAVKAAEQMAGEYGFTPGDQLTLTVENKQAKPSGKATIVAAHGHDLYILTMEQPGVKGDKGVWILASIARQ